MKSEPPAFGAPAASGRIPALDGLRGVAIALVLGFHTFARWPDLMPYGDHYASFPLFQGGKAGVYLFFLISGFVILMTLDRSKTFWAFMKKRWARLFPAMLFASLFLFATQGLVPQRPAGIVPPYSLLPGLSFIEPRWWSFLFQMPFPPLEESFWSLYAEFRFYVFFGFLYFLIGWRKSVALYCALFAAGFALLVLRKFDPALVSPLAESFAEEVKLYGWFAAGALAYKGSSDKNTPMLSAGFLLALLSSVAMERTLKIPSVLCSTLFFATLAFRPIAYLAEHKSLLFLGFISYPLYLLHENLLVGLTLRLHAAAPALPDPATPLLPLLFLLALSWIVAKFIEPRIRRML